MKVNSIVCLLLVGVCAWVPAHASTPINVIFDTDMSEDIDDILALAMLHALHDRAELNLAAVTISTDDRWSASYVDLINTYYGHPQIPIGMVRAGVDVEVLRKKYPEKKWPSTGYTRFIAEQKNPDGSVRYSRRRSDAAEFPEAVALLRKTLAAQPDASVLIIQVGYSTNLARLLDSKADAISALSGRDLVRRKVRLLSAMAGNFGDSTYKEWTIPKGKSEFNLILDVPSAQKVFAQWPGPIVVSGYEIGISMRYPGVSIEQDYAYAAHHPVPETYRFFCQALKFEHCPHDHATYDLTSVLYAARPERGYFSVSEPGTVTVLDDGGSRFEVTPGGTHRHLILSEAQKASALEAMVLLVSQPPVRREP